jgi:hypothetical protein
MWIAGMVVLAGAAIGAITGAIYGKGVVRGALAGANVGGNAIQAVGHLVSGRPSHALGSMAGLTDEEMGEGDPSEKRRPVWEKSYNEASGLGYLIAGDESWNKSSVSKEISKDVLGTVLTIGIGSGLQYGGHRAFQLIQSGGFMFTMGRYAEDLKTAVKESGNVVVLQGYGNAESQPVQSEIRTVHTGDPHRHYYDESGYAEEISYDVGPHNPTTIEGPSNGAQEDDDKEPSDVYS